MNTVDNQPLYGWNTLCWKKIERVVFKLQKRIYRAQRRGDSHCHDEKTAEDRRRYA
jgi:RNA-directed DNA polymerase